MKQANVFHLEHLTSEKKFTFISGNIRIGSFVSKYSGLKLIPSLLIHNLSGKNMRKLIHDVMTHEKLIKFTFEEIIELGMRGPNFSLCPSLVLDPILNERANRYITIAKNLATYESIESIPDVSIFKNKVGIKVAQIIFSRPLIEKDSDNKVVIKYYNSEMFDSQSTAINKIIECLELEKITVLDQDRMIAKIERSGMPENVRWN